MATRWHLRWVMGLALLGASQGLAPSTALAADAVVGTGTPTGCSEAAFNTVLSTVQGSGGGTITFNCGPAAHTIVFTSPKAINSAVTLDGAGRITLSGGDTTSLFTVNFGDSLTLRGLTLTRAGGAGAAVGNFGRLDVINSRLTNNAATNGSGGAISSIGTAALTNTVIISNTAGQNGGGLYNGGTLTISGGQVSGNQATAAGGGLYNAGAVTITGGLISGNLAQTGGGLANAGTLWMGDALVSGNRAAGAGGGVDTTGTVTLTRVTLSHNTAASGGGLHGAQNDTTISESRIEANSAARGGGIAHVGGDLWILNSLISYNGNNSDPLGYSETGGGILLTGGGVPTIYAVTLWRNRAVDGGGLAQIDGGALALINSTVSENHARQLGGGLYLVNGSQLIQHVTVAGNTVDADNPSSAYGAGIFRLASSLTLRHTLLSGNSHSGNGSSVNCYGVVGAIAVPNLSNDGTCGFGAGRDNLSLPLDALQDNGGLTPTHLLPPGSAAVDVGQADACSAFDQRGYLRAVGPTCDIGAIEAGASDPVKRLYLPSLRK